MLVISIWKCTNLLIRFTNFRECLVSLLSVNANRNDHLSLFLEKGKMVHNCENNVRPEVGRSAKCQT